VAFLILRLYLTSSSRNNIATQLRMPQLHNSYGNLRPRVRCPPLRKAEYLRRLSKDDRYEILFLRECQIIRISWGHSSMLCGAICNFVGWILYKRNDLVRRAAAAVGMDYVFLITLGLTALTGMLTLIPRDTAAMGTVLVVHLACIAALFVISPYGKFVHFVYRTLALVRYEVEQRQPHQDAGH
jgi:hypothetical protein